MAAVRDAVGPDVDLMIEAHNRFSASTALRIADRLAAHRPAWLEEPVHHQHLGAMVEVARRSPVPVATGESFTSLAPVRRPAGATTPSTSSSPSRSTSAGCGGRARSRRWPTPTYAVVAPHNAQGPGLPRGLRRSSARCIPNFYVQESFDEFNADWTREIVDRPVVQRDGFVEVPTAPGLGIDLDWDRLAAHPYEREHLLRLFAPGWERRDDAPMPGTDAPTRLASDVRDLDR